MSDKSIIDPQAAGSVEGSNPSAPPAAVPRERRAEDSRDRRGQHRPDEARRGRSDRPRPMSFPDGTEQAFCSAYQVAAVPPDFPVQSRPGVATLRATVVARRSQAILLCDAGHTGEHIWPDGEIADAMT